MPAKVLNEKQAAFVELVGRGVPAVDAYEQVYGASATRKAASVKAARLLRHPLVAASRARQTAIALAAVDAAVERYGITAERVADAMARLAFTDIDQVADWQTTGIGAKRRQTVVIRDARDIHPAAMAAISEIKHDTGGRVTVKLYNKREALMDLARLKGWIADKPVDQRNLVVLKVER